MNKLLQGLLAGLVLSCGVVRATVPLLPKTRYVVKDNPGALAPFTNWLTAAASIQGAVDVSTAGDEIIVSNGVYDTGVRVTPGIDTSNRVVITQDITVRSLNGPDVTSIVGLNNGGSSDASANIRCVYITSGSLSGFTLSSGAAPNLFGIPLARGGGGAYAVGGVLNRCVVTGCNADDGGGVYGGTVNDCVLSGNTGASGGGACQSTLNRCVVSGNSCIGYGGGALGGTLNNCLVKGNAATVEAGGAENCTLNNCTVTGNSMSDIGGIGGGVANCAANNCVIYSNASSYASFANYVNGTYDHCCTTPLPAGTGNFTNNPQFVGAADHHLTAGSPCVNAGSNGYVVGSTDLDGHARIGGGVVDMGAFELPFVTVSVVTNPVAGGTVSGAGSYAVGLTNVTLTATPNAHWVFVRWSDNNFNASRTITVPATNITYTASFTQEIAGVFVRTNPAAGGTVTGGGYFQTGSNVVLTATPNLHWRFVNWNDGETTAVRTVTVRLPTPSAAPRPPPDGITYTANFRSLAALTYGMDFDGDGKADIAIYHAYGTNWIIRTAGGISNVTVGCGVNGSVPLAGDYDGDGKADVAVYNRSSGNWYIRNSSGGTTGPINWGFSGVIPVPGDYDGDSKTDLAVYDPPSGNWYIRNSGGGTTGPVNWGFSGVIPVPGDYDGDGKTDLAVYHRNSGQWYIRKSSGGTEGPITWGTSKMLPVPGDYDGDGKTDIAVYSPANGNWYIIRSSDGTPVTQNWGWSAAAPVPADYDGDGKTDFAVYQQSKGTWYIRYSGGGSLGPAVWVSGGSAELPTLPQFQINRRFFSTP